MAKKKQAKEPEKIAGDNDYTEQFIIEQLKVINGLTNQAKAKRLAERVLRNRKENQ